MNSSPLQIRLQWQENSTGNLREPLLDLPVALGRVFDGMPATLNGQRVSRLTLNNPLVSRFHAIIAWEQGNVIITDIGSRNGTFINGTRQNRAILTNGDIIRVGAYQIKILFSPYSAAPPPASQSQIFFHPTTNIPDSALSSPQFPSVSGNFPPGEFIQPSQVSVQSLRITGTQIDEIDYAAIGAGLGSFVWVDLLRICGVKTSQIIALGMEATPYARYQRLCLHSQIPLHERLRSNSDSCPDNIWGWPSYALREAWQEFTKGNIKVPLQLLWQVFAEPTFAETYTPKAGHVFQALDREQGRIGWSNIFRYGRVRGIRKTDDGRYVIAYSRSDTDRRDHAFLVARYIHLATGYPAIQFLPDLQTYRERTGDFKSVVNAYEQHDYIYEHLEKNGGTVLIRGRGIVASRIIQRLYEARQQNANIKILHLMRSLKTQGNQFGFARRQIENHFEFQPFNWPKACWGGELREILEAADPLTRQQLLKDWGGTTTASRRDWRRIVQEGLNQGWYQITFGEVERVEPDAANRPLTYIQQQGINAQIKLAADFIIDATGLDAAVKSSPLLEDLVIQYKLPLNALGRLSVANDFELVEMRNVGFTQIAGHAVGSKEREGRIYAAGAITLGGPHAAVDSFLGLQYAALCSVKSLAAVSALGLSPLSVSRSLVQWWKWVMNQSPG